jgi:hypothetical protein
MPNMRIIHNNVADTATLTALSNSVTYTVSGTPSLGYLQNDFKSQAFRISKTYPVQFNLTWTANQTIGGVVLPCTNLSSSARIRVILYNSGGTSIADTGADGGNAAGKLACPNTPLTNWTRSTTAPDVNSFSLGGLSKVAVWFNTPVTGVQKVQIDINDTSNLAANLDISRIVCGNYWEPGLNVDREGLQFNISDNTTNTRTDAGELISDQGFVYDQLSFSLGLLAETDRNKLVEIIRSVGTSKNILVSVFPEGGTLQEQQYLIYGKRDNSAIDYVIAGYYSHQLSILGW